MCSNRLLLKIFGGILLCSSILFSSSACGNTIDTKPSSSQTSSFVYGEWHYDQILDFRSVRYTVTKEILSMNQIDQKLGTIAFFGNGETYDIYSVVGSIDLQTIAIKTINGYIKAVKAE